MSIDCCWEKYEGYGCTLDTGHAGPHEAWGGGRRPIAIWTSEPMDAIASEKRQAQIEALEWALRVVFERFPDNAAGEIEARIAELRGS